MAPAGVSIGHIEGEHPGAVCASPIILSNEVAVNSAGASLPPRSIQHPLVFIFLA